MLNEFWALTRSRGIHHAYMVDGCPVVTRVGSIGFESRLIGKSLIGGTIVVITKDNGLMTYDVRAQNGVREIYHDSTPTKGYSSTGPILVLSTRREVIEAIPPSTYRMPREWAPEFREYTQEVLDRIGTDHPGFLIAPEVLEMFREAKGSPCVS